MPNKHNQKKNEFGLNLSNQGDNLALKIDENKTHDIFPDKKFY